jgi:hypothetical protein
MEGCGDVDLLVLLLDGWDISWLLSLLGSLLALGCRHWGVRRLHG